MATVIQDGIGGINKAKVNSNNQLEVHTLNPLEVDGTDNSLKVGSVRNYNLVDEGLITGEPLLYAPYTDQYYRQYVSDAISLDSEQFNYTAQNTGKHTYANTTMTATWSAAGLTTNGSSITTTTTGITFGTYAMFSLVGNASLETEIFANFTAQPNANTIVDFGLFLRGGSTAYAPLDGAYFRLDSAGIKPVINSNGTEQEGDVVDFTQISGSTSYANNRNYRFYIAATVKGVEFWINDILVQKLETPIGLGQPFLAQSVPFSIRHAIVGGAAGAVLQAQFKNYSVISLGLDFNDDLGVSMNRVLGAYQGLSGGTMGSLANYANSANPTPAVPTNTTSTVCTGLGGQGWETDTAAANIDLILMSYQVPAGTVLVQGRRLRVTGVKISSFVQTGLTGGGYNGVFTLNWGHTSVSLATTEAATTKAPRRLPIGTLQYPAGWGALSTFNDLYLDLSSAPVYVNPGEFIAIAKKKNRYSSFSRNYSLYIHNFIYLGIMKDYSAKKSLGIDEATGLEIEVRVTDIFIQPKIKEVILTFEKVLVSPTGIVMKTLSVEYAKRYNSQTVNRFDLLQESPIGLGIEQMLQPDLDVYPDIQQV